MAEKLLINVSSSRTQVATFEGRELIEFRVEEDAGKLVGNIYLGIIRRVLPGLAAACVDIGLERNGFLPMFEAAHFPHEFTSTKKIEKVSSVVSEGQKILVQVTKDPIGNKGARLTGRLSMPSRCPLLRCASSAPCTSSRDCPASSTRSHARTRAGAVVCT